MDTGSKKRTVITDYGQIELEVVKCGACNTEVAKEVAEKLQIGNRNGWACPVCAGEPTMFPGQESDGVSLLYQMPGALSLLLISLPVVLMLMYPFGISILTFPQGLSLFVGGILLLGFTMLLEPYREQWGDDI